MDQRAFTLIELLVVVTIIVILLALLTPALDKAMYQTELTVCGAQLKGNASAVQLYAMDFRRHYPNPAGGRTDSFDHLGPRVGDGLRLKPELVPLLENRLNLKAMLCPMLGGISLSPPDNRPDTALYSNYYMFFGQRYTDQPGNGGMFKIGDRLQHTTGAAPRPDRFNVLMMDLNGVDRAAGYAMTGHPDKDGALPKGTWQNQLNIVGIWVTFSRWQGSNGKPNLRGAADLNFAFDDGSVTRLDDLALNDAKEPADDRTESIPYYPTASNNLWIMVPPVR